MKLRFQDLNSIIFNGFSKKRLVANCDIPDLDLFPLKYPSLKTIHFQAGITPNFIQRGIFWMSFLAKLNVLEPSKHAKFLKTVGDPFIRNSSNESAMQIVLQGTLKNFKGEETVKKMMWTMVANSGHGPNIAIIPPVVLCEKLLGNNGLLKGAFPCVGLFETKEFIENIKDLDVCSYVHFLSEETGFYSRAVGDEFFSKLPEFYRKFHGGEGVAEGYLKVTRGTSIFAKILCVILGFPTTSTSEKGTLATVLSSKNMWYREFKEGSKVYKFNSTWTENRKKHGLLLEGFFGGLVQVGYQMKTKLENEISIEM
jgi:hypothetical protein